MKVALPHALALHAKEPHRSGTNPEKQKEKKIDIHTTS
jgi:hypothetical protein